jgi:transcriptional regulator with XRE-family HTH domain
MVKETLAEYLKRVMHQKNLKVADVQEASGLSQGYINELLRGAKTNLTIETIGILADALDLDGFELFAAAYGKTPENMAVDPHLLADTIQKLILNPDLIELVQNTAKLKSEKHKEAVYGAARGLTRKAKASKKHKK